MVVVLPFAQKPTLILLKRKKEKREGEKKTDVQWRLLVLNIRDSPIDVFQAPRPQLRCFAIPLSVNGGGPDALHKSQRMELRIVEARAAWRTDGIPSL